MKHSAFHFIFISKVSKCFYKAAKDSYRAPYSCFPKKVSFQLSSEQSIGDVWIVQLDWKRVPQAKSSGCTSSVAVNVVCSHRGFQLVEHVIFQHCGVIVIHLQILLTYTR